jgi:hypothetical protein
MPQVYTIIFYLSIKQVTAPKSVNLKRKIEIENARQNRLDKIFKPSELVSSSESGEE